ncbi:MAG: RND family transporter, partial [Gammaproteobacteria bacterium]|nr:RND family transporter [Gammaproteobacteria bacterium]
MDAFERHFANWVIAQRWWILLATLLIVIATGTGIGQLSFNNDNRVYFSKQNPQLLALEALENTFSENENVLIAVEPKDGNVFTRSTLQAVQEITERAWFTPYSSRVGSLSNFQHSYSDGDDLIVEDLYQNPQDLSDAEIAKIKQIALSEPLLVKNLISVDGSVTAINIKVLKPTKSKTAMAEIATFTRQLKTDIEAKYPDLTLHLAGGIMFG